MKNACLHPTLITQSQSQGLHLLPSPPGDFDQKPYVSADADCSVTQLQGDEDLVLLACDGFFDAVKPSEVPRLVLAALRRTAEPDGGGGEDTPAPSEAVAQQLVAHAKAAGSSDNITVLVVFLRPPELLLARDSPQGSSDSGASEASQQ